MTLGHVPLSVNSLSSSPVLSLNSFSGPHFLPFFGLKWMRAPSFNVMIHFCTICEIVILTYEISSQLPFSRKDIIIYNRFPYVLTKLPPDHLGEWFNAHIDSLWSPSFSLKKGQQLNFLSLIDIIYLVLEYVLAEYNFPSQKYTEARTLCPGKCHVPAPSIPLLCPLPVVTITFWYVLPSRFLFVCCLFCFSPLLPYMK